MSENYRLLRAIADAQDSGDPDVLAAARAAYNAYLTAEQKCGTPASPAPPTSTTRTKKAAAPKAGSGSGSSAESFTLGDHVEIATTYARSLGAEAVFDDGAVFVYDASSGLYSSLTEAEESCRVQSYSGAPLVTVDKKTGQPNETELAISSADVSGVIKLTHARLTRRAFFASAPSGLAFADRFVEVTPKGIVTRAHSPTNRARYGYASAFATSRDPSRFLAFLADVFAGVKDAAERIMLLQEFAGAALLGVATKYQLCLVLVGDGANGKSTLIAIIKSAFPRAAVVAVPPQRWEDQYRRATLAGALLNAVSELPENDILASETFKAVISGDEIEGRHIYKPLFHFTPRAGHLFGANKLPSSNDTTHGFWRRFAVVRFERKFEGAQADPELADRIIAEERDAVVAWMVEGARRLMARGHYVIPQSSIDALASWKRNSNPVALFVDERLAPLRDGESIRSAGSTTTVLYDAFRTWAEKSGHKSITKNKFSGKLRELGHEAIEANFGTVFPLRFKLDGGGAGGAQVVHHHHANSAGGSDA
ncbi:MAG: phage/plasmid primase, P4 family [Labilithrix sp.]